ncbi:MAG: MBL fold metallo-hydrolase [Lachnospiraceae bacterium]|nr:MBL fold metallo-hydrolase [Lachnospiraceae bacterium]
MPDIKIGKITLGMAMTNTYFVYREGIKDCIVFDPADKGEWLFQKLSDNGFEVKAIFLTHGHFDHIWGVEELAKLSGAEVYAAKEEEKLLSDPKMNVSASCGRPCSVNPGHLLKDGEEVRIADITIRMIETPGHTGGSCCFYLEEAGFLIAGDTIFCESVGRTDLPTGSMSTLIRSINEKLMTLPDETRVYPGHGEATTIAHEREYNPFL